MKKSKVKKRFVFLTVLILGFLFLKFIPDICFGVGKGLYDTKKYTESLPYLKIATMLNPQNQDFTYYYTLSLTEVPMVYGVQKELFGISKMKNAGAAATLADGKIKKLKYNILNIAGENYIQQTTYSGKVLRWDASKFPIKVYIEAGNGLPQYYLSESQRAFNGWNLATGGFIKFKFVDDAASADITLKFIDQGAKSCDKEGCKYVVANTEPSIFAGQLKSFKIEFLKKSDGNQFFTPDQVFLISMHEIGHALGIMGHSFYPDNLMYPSSVEQDSSTAQYRARGLSYQDVNTIKLLYSLAPEISNSKFSEKEFANFIYPPVILGDAQEMGDQKIQQAKNYIQNAPNLPNGYIDLAEAYFGIKKYDEAINALNSGLQVCSTDDDRYMVYYNMAVVNYEAKNYPEAKVAIDNAKNIKSSQEADELAAQIAKKLK